MAHSSVRAQILGEHSHLLAVVTNRFSYLPSGRNDGSGTTAWLEIRYGVMFQSF